MRILITGAAGAIGSTLVKEMKERHSLRGFDRVSTPDLKDAIIGNISDFDIVLKAIGYHPQDKSEVAPEDF